MMGEPLKGHHLTTFIQLKVIEEHVLTDEWKSATEMYPVFEREVKARSKVSPVQSHNFRVHLKKMVKEGRAQVMLKEEGKDTSVKLYRKMKKSECGRCGECCRWLVLCDSRFLTAKALAYVKARGGKIEQGLAVVPSECPHLHMDFDNPTKYRCDIYESRPLLCKEYVGNRMTAETKFWIPDCCEMVVK